MTPPPTLAGFLLGALLLSGPGTCQEDPPGPEELTRILEEARHELARVEEAARAAAAGRARERKDLLERLLAREQEERRLAARLAELRRGREEASLAADRAEKEARELAGATVELEKVARRGARAILGRTAGSLAGLGSPAFTRARRELAARLGAAEEGKEDPAGALLQAALELTLAELGAGSQIALVTETLPDPAGAAREARLVRVGLLGAAGPAGILMAEQGGQGFRLVRPASLFSGWRLKSALQELEAMPRGAREAAVPLDVSGGLALAGLGAERGLWETLAAGGPVMVPILAVGLLGLLLALLRGLALLRERRSLRYLGQRIPELVARGDLGKARQLCQRRGGAVGATLAGSLAAAGHPPAQQERLLDQVLLQGALGLERFLGTLGVLGTLAPFLGLLGTVTGMISTFSALTASAGRDSSALAGGIAEALVTTEFGLVVAIPLVLLHSFLSGRAERAGADMEEMATSLTLSQGRKGEA